MNKLQTIIAVKQIKGTSFVGIRNYTNKSGETSNQIFIVGISYRNLLEKDLNSLLNIDLEPLSNKIDMDTLTIAKNELIESLNKRLLTPEEKEILLANNDNTIIKSNAQQNAFIEICKGLKKKDNELYIYGLCVKKTIITKGEHKEVQSSTKTIAKQLISKHANLKAENFKRFKINNANELKISGITING